MAEFMKCNTCLASFPSMEVIKDHYRSDWHCFNSKRRAQGLTILRREQFLELVKSNTKSAPKASAKSAVTTFKEDHSKVKQVAVAVKPTATTTATATATTTNTPETEEQHDEQGEKEEEEEEEENEEVSKRVYEPKLGSHVSVFDDKECKSAEDCLQYMSFKFGFFIPDMEYLVDLDGFLSYCNEKVKMGGVCLFCQKVFPDGRACQHHMHAKSHCKIAYENDADAEEFEDFYDFSATYEDVDDVDLDENGDVIQDEASVNAVTGELILPDGKVLGHRDFRVYYRQYYRPTDTREPVLAQQREELLRLGCKFGKHIIDANKVTAMSEIEVMDALIKYQKAIRKGQVTEQRAKLRHDAMTQRKEYKSSVAKLRSSETTTAKIRDYHGLL